MTTQRFTAIISKDGSRNVIVLPFNPNQVWGVKQRHHIRGMINGCLVRGALAGDASKFVLPLGPAWLRDNGIALGVEVMVELTSEGPQIDTLADDIRAALLHEPEARAFFESLATFYRTGYLRWIEGARRTEIRQARITELLELLKAGKKQR